MSIDLRLLRFAKALVDHGTFSRAAEALNIAQPSLSRGIQELESRVGMVLFLRSRMGIELTDFGRVFMEHAEKILQHSRDLDVELASVRRGGSNEVSVAMGPVASEALGARCAIAFSRAYPSHRIRISHAEPGSALRMLRERKVDLLVLESSVINDEDAELVDTLPPVNGQIFVRAGHPLLQRHRPAFAEILEFPFVQVNMLPPRILQQVLPLLRSGKTPHSRPFPAVVCPTVRMALGVLAESDAFMFGNAIVLSEECASGRIVPLEVQVPWLHVQWGVFRLRLRDVSPEMAAAIDVVKTAYAELFGAVGASAPGEGN